MFNFLRKQTAPTVTPPSPREKLVERYGDIVNSFDEKEVRYLDHVTTGLDRFEDKIGVVYEIGANNGMWTQAFAMYTNQDVYAFEPIESMIELLKEKQKRNSHIKLVPLALGEKEEESVIHIENSKAAASSILDTTDLNRSEFPQYKIGETTPQKIKIVRLDDWRVKEKAPFPSLILLDVQGFEEHVLKGGLETLRNTKYIWVELNFKEMFKGGSTVNTLYPFLHEHGFDLIDCVELVRSKKNDQLLYMDGIFINRNLK